MTDRLVLTVSLLGEWHEFDIADLLGGAEYADARSVFAAAGFDVPALENLGKVVLLAYLWEDALPEDRDQPPMIAAVVITEHETAEPLPVASIGTSEIVPVRRVTRRPLAWPTSDVGQVEVVQVGYLVPEPGGARHYVAEFTTPNLPIAEDMEFLFDSIMATMTWAEASPA